MEPKDIGRLISVASPAVSPDGRRVAFVVTRVHMDENTYRSAVWLADVAGDSPPRQLTSGEFSDGNPAWSPDGSTLAFTSRRKEEKDEKHATLHLLSVDGPGEVVTLATSPEGIGSLRFSPDGDRIAYTARRRSDRYDTGDDDASRKPRKIDRLYTRLDSVGWIIDRPTQVWVVPVDGSVPAAAVTEGPFEHDSPDWSPDGTRLVFAAGRAAGWDRNALNDLYISEVGPDAACSEPRRVTDGTYSYQAPSWSPDGSRIAALADDPAVVPGQPQLVLVDPDDGTTTELARSIDRSCAPYPGARPPIWDGDALWFAIEDRGDVSVQRVEVAADGSAAADPVGVVTGARNITGFDRQGETLAFVSTTVDRLPELYVLVDGEERRLTSLTDRFHRAVPSRRTVQFTVPSPGGGDVDAWITVPDGFDPDAGSGAERWPMLLSVHGGPMTQYGNRWFDEIQVLASAGYVVLWANPHGSSGRDEAFLRSIRSPIAPESPGTGWGGIDFDDLMAVVDAALERWPSVDPERLGILGGSYGGYMTSWAVGHTDRFAAACSERAVNNMLTLETSSDAAGWFHHEVGVTHLDAPEEYLRQSPITYVKDIDTPMLILHSEEDLRCPVEQADQLFVALRMLDKEVEYYRFPGESHELSRSGSPTHRVQRMDIILEFFGRHLKPADAQTSGPERAEP